MSVFSFISRNYAFFGITIIVVVVSSLVCQVIGDNSCLILVDPVDNVKSSKPFSVSGSATGLCCKRVGVEIYPKNYWEKASYIADIRKAKGFRFSLLSVIQSITDEGITGNDETYWGVFLHIFNPDGTIAYQSAPSCPNHRIHFAPVIQSSKEKGRWSTIFNTDNDRRMLTPDIYELLVWDATDQSIYVNTHIANIYDPKNHKIYPTTKKGPIWEPDNEKELICKTFEVN